MWIPDPCPPGVDIWRVNSGAYCAGHRGTTYNKSSCRVIKLWCEAVGSTTHNELNRPRDAGNENGTLRQGSGCVFFSCRPDLTRGSRPPACPPARPPARLPVRRAQRAPACRSVPARLNAFQRAPACSSALPPAPARPPARPPFPPPAVRGASHVFAMAVALPVLSRRVVSCSVVQVVCSIFSSRIMSSLTLNGDAQRFTLAFGFFCCA